jgi:starch synthase
VGDVVRDLPAALGELGWPTTVLTPSYGVLHNKRGARELEPIEARFRGVLQTVRVFEVQGSESGVRNIVLDSDLFVAGEAGRVYSSDEDSSRPFATDAPKFAFYCAAAAAWIEARESLPAVVHLHDWHAGVYAALRRFDSSFSKLAKTRTVFTIHNLAYQGQRPMRADESSFEDWFPGLSYDPAPLADPANDDVFNPMAAAIRLSDCVNTVSPSYAREIVHPSDPEAGFSGGEGLEGVLQATANDERLAGILNGCDYSEPVAKPPGWHTLLSAARTALEAWQQEQPAAAHQLALERIAAMPKRRPLHLVTSIGRVVEQKMRLFLEPSTEGATALEAMLEQFGDGGIMMLLGSGDTHIEQRLATIAERHSNLVYFSGYSEALGDALYATGDLFLMPSSFEPCGISQMLAMRAGQPCVVHGVGGLNDTVTDGENGFVFGGRTPREQADAFVARVAHAIALRRDDPLAWDSVRDAARNARFDWKSSAEQYIRQLYDYRSH